MRLWCALWILSGCSRAPEPVHAPPPPSVGRLDDEPLYENGDLMTIADGGAVMARGASGWQPLGAPGRRIELSDGSYWLALGFATDETGPRARWISPAHPKSEIVERRSELEEEAQKLPPNLLEQVKPQLELIALVSTLEGRFADPATHPDDRAASLGIFQWATERASIHSAGSTLSRFFTTLAKRSQSGEPLYADAWKQCQKLKLTFSAGDMLINKKRLTGAELEDKLGPEMGRGALRSYQLIAALDWIDEVKKTVVRPGLRSINLVGHEYAEAERGRLITLKINGHTLEFRPSTSATLGDYFHSEAALATAVSLGVNRPRYVEAALWQALRGDQNDKIDRLLAQLNGAADRERWKSSELEAQPAYAEIQSLLWPQPASEAEVTLERDFTERALALYRPFERERRARRLVTGR
jgi:hypothetical protein